MDGKKLEWLITAPELTSAGATPLELENPTVVGVGVGKGSDVRGRLPFFCGDLTPREFRVSFGFNVAFPILPRVLVCGVYSMMTLCFKWIMVKGVQECIVC